MGSGQRIEDTPARDLPRREGSAYFRPMQPMSPLYTADLFPPLYQALEALLRDLAPEDWQRPTIAGAWQVRDVVAHLLDGDLRKLSAYRDGHVPAPAAPLQGYEDLVHFLNGLNAEW